MVYDFHTHSTLSDGRVAPAELLLLAAAKGYQAIALTDHVSEISLENVLPKIIRACAEARQMGKTLAIPGVELTGLRLDLIAETAKRAKELGAWLVIAHGETIVELIPKGTNKAAILSPHVDILAHPGLITEEEVKLAAARGVYLEISARRGHCLTNGHVASLARQFGAKLLLDTDCHDAGDLLTDKMASAIVHGTGLDAASCERVLIENPSELIAKLTRERQLEPPLASAA